MVNLSNVCRILFAVVFGGTSCCQAEPTQWEICHSPVFESAVANDDRSEVDTHNDAHSKTLIIHTFVMHLACVVKDGSH